MAVAPYRGYAETDRGEVGAGLNSLQKQVDALKAGLTAITAVTVSIPEVDTSFAPLYDRSDKRGLYVTLAFFIPGDTQDLKIVMVERGTVTDVASFGQKRIKRGLENAIEDSHRAAGRVEDRIDVRLKYNATYDIIRLISIGSEGSRHQNPEGDPAFTGSGTPPYDTLYSFVTPEQFGVPSSPRLVDILLNNLDSFTEDFDVKVRVRIYSPLNDSGQAQAWGIPPVDKVMPVFTRASTGDKLKEEYRLSGVELTQTIAGSPTVPNRGFVDVDVTGFKPGTIYTWDKNVCWTLGEKRESTGAAVSFTAGPFSQDPSTLLALSLTITPDDSRRAAVALNFTQPTPAVALKWVKVERRLTADPDIDASYNTVVKKFSLRGDEYYTVGAHPLVMLDDTVKTKPSKLYTWKCTIMAVGGLTTTFQVATVGSEALDIPAASLQTTHKNLIEGGAFLTSANSFGTGTADQVGRQFFIQASTASTRIDRTTTFAANGIGWDDTNHRIKMGPTMLALGGKLCTRIRKQVLPGSTWNFGFLIRRSSTSLIGRDFTVDLYDEGAGAVMTGATITKGILAKSAGYRIFWGVFQVDPSYQMNGRQWLRIYPVADTSTAEYYFDNLCLNKGAQFKLWEPGDGEASLDSDVTVTVDTGSEQPGSIANGFTDSSGTFFQVVTNPSGVVTLSTAT